MVKKKEMSERKEAWFRILVFIISGIILEVWKYLIIILALFNWVITVFSGNRHKELAKFSEHWNTESYKFFRYLTFVSNKKPFPFSKMERLSKFEE